MPVAVAAAITLGVAPLLFVQVVYQQFFYSGTILVGWAWLLFLVMLMLGYYAAYAYKFRGAPARGSGGTGWLVVASVMFLLISMVHVAVNLVQEFERTIFRELDMHIEAGTIDKFARQYQYVNEIHIPNVFWELTSVCSFLLVGFDHGRAAARAAALKALVVTGAGGLVLLARMISPSPSSSKVTANSRPAAPARTSNVVSLVSHHVRSGRASTNCGIHTNSARLRTNCIRNTSGPLRPLIGTIQHILLPPHPLLPS